MCTYCVTWISIHSLTLFHTFVCLCMSVVYSEPRKTLQVRTDLLTAFEGLTLAKAKPDLSLRLLTIWSAIRIQAWSFGRPSCRLTFFLYLSTWAILRWSDTCSFQRWRHPLYFNWIHIKYKALFLATTFHHRFFPPQWPRRANRKGYEHL